MSELLSANSPYIQQARGGATRAAAARGLQNSSIAGQGGEQAAIAAALPIAQSDAATYDRRALTNQGEANLFGRQRAGFEQSQELMAQQGRQAVEQQRVGGEIQTSLQQREIENQRWTSQFDAATQERLQGLDIATRERMQRAGFTQEQVLQSAEFGQAQALQQREIENQRWSQQFDAATRERLQGMDLAARERMQQQGFTQEQVVQQADLAARERMQQTEVQSQQWLAQFDASTRERLQGLDADVRQQMQQLDVASQQRIADMNVSASSRSDAARMASTLELSYSTMLQTIMNNPDIPADARQSYIDHANTIRDSNLALVEQMFAVDLEW